MREQKKNVKCQNSKISRRDFLSSSAALVTAFSIIFRCSKNNSKYESAASELDFPLIDYHIHLEEGMTVEQAVELSKSLGVKFGIVEHGGFNWGMKNDEEIKHYIERLDGYPVFKGMQAEGLDWMKCFSKEVVAQLDYVLSDALTFPEKDGRLVHLWIPQEVKIKDKQDFMDRYVDFNVKVISCEPIDIFANPSFLPHCIADEYEKLWTEDRMKKVIEAAVKYDVAIEINSRYNIPKVSFINIAKTEGAKFSFGSNYHEENFGKLDYCLKTAKMCGLTQENMFMPKPPGMKPIQTRIFES